MANQGDDFVPLVPYNGTFGTGGDSIVQNLNVFYQSGDLAWVAMSTALVLLMIPGVGFFYSGLARRKSAMSLIWVCLMATGTISFQWFFWGYSLTYSHTAGKYIGDLANFGFRGVLAAPSVVSPRVPDLLFAVYQMMFACFTTALAVGAVAERGRMLPCVIFMLIWSTIIYDPIACWTWNPNGWSYNLPGLDFAGGTPVHICSGSTALAYSLILGKRRGHGTHELNYRPHNITYVTLGTVFMWVGWFGFNGGTALAANMRMVMALVNTNIAASIGGVAWCLLDYWLERKFSSVGFCSGAIAGLVVITPGAGYVPSWAAIIFGLVGGTLCNLATKLKFFIGIDDSLDIFAVHGIGGFAGNMLTGLFAANYIARLDGFTEIDGGWLDRHWIQLAYQLSDSVTGMAYSFGGSLIILFLMNFVPGLQLRVSEQAEMLGLDDAELGEFAVGLSNPQDLADTNAYKYDYVEHTRDVFYGDSPDESSK